MLRLDPPPHRHQIRYRSFSSKRQNTHFLQMQPLWWQPRRNENQAVKQSKCIDGHSICGLTTSASHATASAAFVDLFDKVCSSAQIFALDSIGPTCNGRGHERKKMLRTGSLVHFLTRIGGLLLHSSLSTSDGRLLEAAWRRMSQVPVGHNIGYRVTAAATHFGINVALATHEHVFAWRRLSNVVPNKVPAASSDAVQKKCMQRRPIFDQCDITSGSHVTEISHDGYSHRNAKNTFR
jgi:hypothetical protein